MKCAVTQDLEDYLAQIDEEDEAGAAREAEFESVFEDVPDTVLEVIRHWLGKNPEFCAEIDAALDKLIYERSAP